MVPHSVALLHLRVTHLAEQAAQTPADAQSQLQMSVELVDEQVLPE